MGSNKFMGKTVVVIWGSCGVSYAVAEQCLPVEAKVITASRSGEMLRSMAGRC
jgi:short-subunit dehydrogenase